MEQLEKRLYGYIKYLEKKENKIKETMENVNGAGHYFRAGQVEELRFVIKGFSDILESITYEEGLKKELYMLRKQIKESREM